MSICLITLPDFHYASAVMTRLSLSGHTKLKPLIYSMSLLDPNDAMAMLVVHFNPQDYGESYLNLTLATWSKCEQIRKKKNIDPQLHFEKEGILLKSCVATFVYIEFIYRYKNLLVCLSKLMKKNLWLIYKLLVYFYKLFKITYQNSL